MRTDFELLLFSVDEEFIPQAVAAGVSGVIVDWENHEKKARQTGFDTEINHHTLEDLKRVRSCTTAPVICRINAPGASSADEIELALDAGANEILVPMVRTPAEVVQILYQVRGRCDVGILVETVAAIEHAHALAALPLKRVYVGLNDLAIQRRTPSIFTPIADGALDRLRDVFTGTFGFGGVTLPDCGFPIECRLLIGELARQQADFSFLRRSFHADIADRQLNVEIPRIHAALRSAFQRSTSAVERDHKVLCTAIETLMPGANQAPAHAVPGSA